MGFDPTMSDARDALLGPLPAELKQNQFVVWRLKETEDLRVLPPFPPTVTQHMVSSPSIHTQQQERAPQNVEAEFCPFQLCNTRKELSSPSLKIPAY